MKHIWYHHHAVSNILGYVFAFSISALIMMSTLLVTESMISDKTNDVIEVKAQSIANQVADIIIDAMAIKKTMPEASYSRSYELPLNLVGSEYYTEITDTSVYVNTTNGQVSKQSKTYNADEFDVNLYGRVYGSEGSISISYQKPIYYYKIDFGTGNCTQHSPVGMGYYFASDTSNITATQREPTWWNASYGSRIPIIINNTVPENQRAKYNASDLINTTISVVISSENFDYEKSAISLNIMGYTISDCIFIDPSTNPVTKIPYCVDFHKIGDKTIFLLKMNITKNSTKQIYLYFHRNGTSYHYPSDVAEFYDNFGDQSCSWNKTYDIKRDIQIAHAVATVGSNVYVVGSANNLTGDDTWKDWWIKKFDIYGYEYTNSEAWNKSFDGGASGDDEALGVAVDSSQNVYVVGYITGKTTGKDWLIKKYNKEGEKLWGDKIFDGGQGDDVAYSVAVDKAQNVYVVGYITGKLTGKDWWIKKFNSDGIEDTTKWNKILDGVDRYDDVAYSVATYETSMVYVVGSTQKSTSPSYVKWWIKGFTSDGTNLANWDKVYGVKGNNTAYSVATAEINKNTPAVYVVGCIYSGDSTGVDWWIKKFYGSVNGTEDLRWNKTFGTRGEDIAYSVTTHRNGTGQGPINNGNGTFVYVAGYHSANNDPNMCNWTIKKYDASGSTDGREILAGMQGDGWNKEINGDGNTTHNRDKCYSVTTDSRQNVYLAGYGTNLVNFTDYQTHEDWWIKKFNKYGEEIKTGLKIDPERWDMSDITDISYINSEVYYGHGGIAWLRYNQYILSKYYRIQPPSLNNKSLYAVEANIETTMIPKTAYMIFLSSSNKTFTSNLTHIEGSYYNKIYMSTKVNSTLSQVKNYNSNTFNLSKINISTTVNEQYNSSQFFRIRSYIHLNNTNSNPTNVTSITTYLYDDTTYAPFNDNIFCKDNQTSPTNNDGAPYLNGYIGFASTGAQARNATNYLQIDWVRVLKLAPSFQPAVTLGIQESINYGWRNCAKVKSANYNLPEEFYSNPIYRDHVNVSDQACFNISYMQRSPSSGGGQGAGTDQPNQQPNYDQPYRITITFGNVTKPTPQCSLTWKFYNCEDIHEKMECDSPIILPITNAGEFKSVWFTFVVPKEYKKTNLSLIFSTTTPKDIASITVEQPDPRQPTYALINIAGGTKQ